MNRPSGYGSLRLFENAIDPSVPPVVSRSGSKAGWDVELHVKALQQVIGDALWQPGRKAVLRRRKAVEVVEVKSGTENTVQENKAITPRQA